MRFFAYFSALSNVMTARMAKSLDFQKYSIMGYPFDGTDDWLIKEMCSFSDSKTKGSK